MPPLKDKSVRPAYPRDGETDVFRPDVEYKVDADYPDKYLIASMGRILSLWEQQLDRLVVLCQGKKGVFKVTWTKVPNGKGIFPVVSE